MFNKHKHKHNNSGKTEKKIHSKIEQQTSAKTSAHKLFLHPIRHLSSSLIARDNNTDPTSRTSHQDKIRGKTHGKILRLLTCHSLSFSLCVANLRSSPRTTFCLLTTCDQAHYVFPHDLVASSVVGKSNRKSQRRRGQSRDIKTRQATHLRDPDAAVGELGGDASLPSSACIAFLRLAPFHKTGTDFDATFVPRGFAVLYTISRSGIESSKSAPPSAFSELICDLLSRLKFV